MPLIEIPGLAEARAKESTAWDAAFLTVNENIAGFEVRPLTLRHVLVLRLMQSPLVTGGQLPTPAQLAAFLWLLSPDYVPGGGRARQRFLRRCRAFLPPRPPLIRTRRAMKRWQSRTAAAVTLAGQIITAARTYISEAYQDRPGGTAGSEESYFSDAAFICGKLALEGNFTRSWEETMDLPVKVAFQFLKVIRRYHDPTRPLFRHSDSLVRQWLAENEERLTAEEIERVKNMPPPPLKPGEPITRIPTEDETRALIAARRNN